MPYMNDQFARIEAQLEKLIEGAFAQVFGKNVRPQDIALRLSRAMEDNLRESDDNNPRPYAPDQYVIRMNIAVAKGLLERQPSLTDILSQHMVELASSAEYRLRHIPTIEIVGDANLSPMDINLEAFHVNIPQSNTEVLSRPVNLDATKPDAKPNNPQLIINGETTILLNKPILNIGRSRDNHLVLDDLFISRHHIQLRLRFGRYTLFDTNSQSGTKVNDVSVREHRLQSGDVIRLGKTQILYLEDNTENHDDDGTGINQSIDPQNDV